MRETEIVRVILSDDEVLLAFKGQSEAQELLFSHPDAREIGLALKGLGYAPENVTFPDWREPNSPTSGQKVAIKSALRGL